MPTWSLEQNAAGRGVVKHYATPRFTAKWTSGTAKGAASLEPCWSDAGSGDGADSLHIFGFQWSDPRPDFAAFDRLMLDAAKVIDAWIASRL